MGGMDELFEAWQISRNYPGPHRPGYPKSEPGATEACRSKERRCKRGVNSCDTLSGRSTVNRCQARVRRQRGLQGRGLCCIRFGSDNFRWMRRKGERTTDVVIPSSVQPRLAQPATSPAVTAASTVATATIAVAATAASIATAAIATAARLWLPGLRRNLNLRNRLQPLLHTTRP